jgi:chromosome partitioning protein
MSCGVRGTQRTSGRNEAVTFGKAESSGESEIFGRAETNRGAAAVRRVAILNQKGGVGKTTTAANLGAALAELGVRVLLVDIDSQANLSLHLTPEGEELPERSIFDVLVENRAIADCLIERSEEQLRLLPASTELAGAEQALANTIGRELILRDALDAYAEQENVDLVLIDCPPSLGVLSLNALAAAEFVLVPVQTEFFALQGMSQLLEVIELVRKRLNPSLEILGLLACLVDARLNLAQEVVQEIENYFGSLLFQTRIRKNIKLAEAPSFGKSILRYAPDSNGANDHRALAREVAERLDLRIHQSGSDTH